MTETASSTPLPAAAAALIAKIEAREARVGIVGLGYVGLPLLLRFAEQGFPVIGFDNDPDKIVALGEQRSYIEHIPSSRLAGLDAQRTRYTADFKLAAEADVLLLCVPTPLSVNREPDLSFVVLTVEALLPHLQPGQLMVLESTTYPGTTDEELLPRIEAGGLRVGIDYFLAYSPEREDPGNAHFTTQTIPKVCGGTTPACAAVSVALYSAVIDKVVPVSSTRAAELTKILENVHRAVNVGLVNEMKIVADRMGIDIHEVIDAAATKPFGFVPYYPGPGLGGHCIPIDPFYLTWKAREYGVNTRFIELAGEINGAMPDWVVRKVAEGLNQQGKPVRGSQILILGLAYKKNVGDSRESPSVAILDALNRSGAVVSYSDPHVPEFPRMRRYSYQLSSVPLTAATLQATDCVLIATDHDAFDYPLILEHAPLVVDTRGRYRKPAPNLVKA